MESLGIEPSPLDFQSNEQTPVTPTFHTGYIIKTHILARIFILFCCKCPIYYVLKYSFLTHEKELNQMFSLLYNLHCEFQLNCVLSDLNRYSLQNEDLSLTGLPIPPRTLRDCGFTFYTTVS